MFSVFYLRVRPLAFTCRWPQVLPALTLAVHAVMNMLTLVSLVESNYYAEAPETVTGALNAVLSHFFHSSDFSISCKHLLSRGPAASAIQGQSEASFCLRGTRLNFFSIFICLLFPSLFPSHPLFGFPDHLFV